MSMKSLLLVQLPSLWQGDVKKVEQKPAVCSPLSVVVNGVGKKRLVVNLRHVNRYLTVQKFKYEDLRVAMLLFKPGEWMFSFDLKSGYHHVDIIESHQTFLGFEWGSQFYVFTVLPFGLSTAPYVFTKLLRPLVRLWRGKGCKAVLYLDDGICAVEGEEEAFKVSSWVRETLDKAGLVANEAKCTWTPTHKLQWLGFNVDLEHSELSVPEKKLSMLKRLLRCAATQQCISARSLASIIGRIISMGLALGPVARFMTRSLYAMLELREAWCDMLTVTQAGQMELEFWAKSIESYNGQPIWRGPSAVRVAYSDASDTGYGGYTVLHGMHVAHGCWKEHEAKQSSTWRELVAVARVMESVANKLGSTRVRWFTDNQNVVRILQVGSGKAHLQVEALRVFELCVQYQIHLEPEWLPREENQLADYLSRIVDYDDWYLNPEVFSMLESLWGPHTVDRFANHRNTHLPRFNSRYACIDSEAVDAFTVHWGGENNWWCPPPYLIPRVLKHAEVCKAKGTLVVPAWESGPFWPLICPNGHDFAKFVEAFVSLPLLDTLFCPGESGQVLFHGKVPNSAVYALRVNFLA